MEETNEKLAKLHAILQNLDVSLDCRNSLTLSSYFFKGSLFYFFLSICVSIQKALVSFTKKTKVKTIFFPHELTYSSSQFKVCITVMYFLSCKGANMVFFHILYKQRDHILFMFHDLFCIRYIKNLTYNDITAYV